MATADGITGRPSRRHAHVCRICDATFGCKAELLEHEQENHLRGQSKTIKRKSSSVTSTETIIRTEEISVGKLQSPAVRKAIAPTVVREIAVDHEEIYDSSTVSSISKHLKRDKNLSNSSPSSKGSAKQSKPILATDSKSAQLEVSGYRGMVKSRQHEDLSIRMQGSSKRILELGSGSENACKSLRPDGKAKEPVVDHESKSDEPVTGLNEIETVKESLHLASATKELDSGKHLRHSSVDVMTLLGLKRKRNEDGKSLVSRGTNDVCVGIANKIGLEVTQEKPGLTAEIKSSSLSELPRNNYVSISQRKGEPNSKNEPTVIESLPQSSVNIQTEDAKTKNLTDSLKSDAVGNNTSLNYLVVETGPASEMYIDSAECSNEVTVIETPSNKATKKRAQLSPKFSPLSITSMPPPVTNNPGGTLKRMVALTVAPSTPRMVSVLLLNRDGKQSSESQSQSGNQADCINAEYGALQNTSKSEEVRDNTRPIEVSASLSTKENSAAERCSLASSSSPTVGKSSVTLAGGKIISSLPSTGALPSATAIRTLISVSSVPPLLLNKNVHLQKSQSSDELEPVVHRLKLEKNNDAVSISCELVKALDDELSEESAVEAITVNSSGDHSFAPLEEDIPDMCKFCMKKFDDIEKHLMSDHVCKQCGKEFRQAANLRKHIRVSHENVRPHQCPICSKGFAFMSNLSAHLPVHFQSEPGEDKQFACTQCDRAFKHSASLRKHTKEEHIVGPKPHICQHCNKSFVFKCALDCHMRKHSGFRPFTCATCGTGFKHMSNLQKHVKVLHPGPCKVCLDDTQQCEHVQAARAALKAKFTCAECNRSFDCAASLTTHVRSHTGEKPETCHMCGRSFQHRSNLQKHMMKHIGRKPHACTICPRAFYARHNLIAHMRKHTGNSPHECKTCGKRFCTKNSLQVHMNLHANVRPFACDVCGRQFSQLGNLQKHMSVHTGERPHVCVECKRSFTDISALKRHHAAIHERDARYVCEICDKRFLHLSSVRSHRLLHTGVKPHKCDTCGKAFTHKSGWLRHVRLHERANGAGAIVGANKEVVLKPGEYIVYLTE